MTERVTQVRIRGMRAIEDLELDLDGLTVLIGENGTGKSSIIEALEMLRLAGKPIDFVADALHRAHGGLQSLLRRGSRELRFGVTVAGDGPAIDYDFAVADIGAMAAVIDEQVTVHPEGGKPVVILTRNASSAKLVPDGTDGGVSVELTMGIGGSSGRSPGSLVASRLGPQPPAIQRIIDALERIEVHVPFETRPLWQQHQLNVRAGPRWPSEVQPTRTIERYGLNLPNAYQQIRNLDPGIAERVLDRLRLGIASDVRDFVLTMAGRGNLELELRFGRWPDKPLPIDSLSEGQIAYLAFVALVELNANRSVLAFDEPELHLHPALLAEVVGMLEQVAERGPVILATQSDRLLDALTDPAASVVLCELDENRATTLLRPNRERLDQWLQRYGGLGAIRSEGYERQLFGNRGNGDGR